MRVEVRGRTQFNIEAFIGADLDQLLEDLKQFDPVMITEIWEKYNNQSPKKKKKKPVKKG